MISIRVDFDRRGFCLYANGEPFGKLYHQYKHASLARDWLREAMAEEQS